MKATKTPVKKTVSSHHPRDKEREKENSKSISKSRELNDSTCDICAQHVPGPEREKIYAFGHCDHHVCYVCSARLRAICDQFECPICRMKLESVVFSSNKNRPFDKFNLKDCLSHDKYQVYFENLAIKRTFEKLLKFECLICSKKKKDSPTPTADQPTNNCANNDSNGNSLSSSNKNRTNHSDEPPLEFKDVSGLKNHLNFVHKLKLCDLCLTHNKLFPFEFSYYDARSLAEHKRKGEPKTSHRGHPNCELCHITLFNTDELILHMSREHFHCHLCEREESSMRIYFLDYADLRNHFKTKHFLCERDNCRHEQFTSAFHTEIDFQLHQVNVHGNATSGLSRGEARQQRTITLDAAPHRVPTSRRITVAPPNAAVVSTGPVATANNPRRLLPESIQLQIRQQRLPSRSEFPALGCSTSSSFLHQQDTSTSNGTRDNYPALAGNSGSSSSSRFATLSERMVAGPSSSSSSFVRSMGGGLRPPRSLDEMDFPPLPEQPKPKSASTKANKQKTARETGDRGLTLDQLINANLTISSRSNNNSKKKPVKPSKNAKPKALKIQL